jgi:hypothetical protein
VPVYDNYESDSELDMQDIQEHTTEPYPLFLKGYYHEEIIPHGPAEDTEQQDEEQSFPMGPVYDDYEFDPWESQEEEPGEPEEQQEDSSSHVQSLSVSSHHLRKSSRIIFPSACAYQ